MSTVTTRASAASGRPTAEQVHQDDRQGGGDGGGGNDGPDPNLDQEPIEEPAAPASFALVPAQATRGILNYSKPEGIKTFQSVTRSVYYDSSESFNCELEGLWDFLQLIEQRANLAGFDGILQIPHREYPTAQPIALPFLANHGKITRYEVQEHAATYVGAQTRDAQDSIMLYNLLWNSLSAAGRTKVGVKAEQYVIQGITAGVPFLKIIIEDSGVETHATVSNIRMQLTSLDEYMSTIGSDIKKFNVHVSTLMKVLRNHGQTSTDLLIHLFKGYKEAKDEEFVRFIKHKEELYEEGAEMTAEGLMEKAENKYKILLNRGEWKATPKADKRILALETKIKHLEKKGSNAAKGKANANKQGKTNTRDPPQTNKDNKKRDIPDWMKTPPKSGEESKSKKVDGKEYWWCTALKRWCLHKPVDCRAGKAGKDKKFPNKNDQTKKLKFAKALEAIDGHDSEASDDE